MKIPDGFFGEIDKCILQRLGECKGIKVVLIFKKIQEIKKTDKVIKLKDSGDFISNVL